MCTGAIRTLDVRDESVRAMTRSRTKSKGSETATFLVHDTNKTYSNRRQPIRLDEFNRRLVNQLLQTLVIAECTYSGSDFAQTLRTIICLGDTARFHATVDDA